ncbi:MAG: GIY-YIG nuclease family protein [Bacteroidota bacterium]|nr:MAG: GIY-YIG nuclease family protein [Bacteroidota bacterium]
MAYKVYILFSPTHNKLYVGYTSSLSQRLESHNIKGTKDWTRSYRPWILIHIEFFDTKTEALQREKFYKSGKGREMIRGKILPTIQTL